MRVQPVAGAARRAGLASVPHGGELLGAAHVAQVLEHLRPDRLGHGVRSTEDPRLLAEVVAHGVALELCPASNVSLGVFAEDRQVPLRALVDAGATVALGADDPLLFGSRLVAQYEVARHVHGFSDLELAELARSSVRASRATEPTRHRLLAGIDGWLAGPAQPGPGT